MLEQIKYDIMDWIKSRRVQGGLEELGEAKLLWNYKSKILNGKCGTIRPVESNVWRIYVTSLLLCLFFRLLQYSLWKLTSSTQLNNSRKPPTHLLVGENHIKIYIKVYKSRLVYMKFYNSICNMNTLVSLDFINCMHILQLYQFHFFPPFA